MTKNQSRADSYLMQIRNMDKEIREEVLKIDYLLYKASGAGAIRYDKDHVQTSPDDMMCEAVTEAVTRERRLTIRHKKLMEMREHTENIIKLWDDNSARFIDIYYLSRKSMTDVAEQIGCSARNVYLIKMKALEKFSKYI